MVTDVKDNMYGKIHESRLPLLEAKFRNINKKLNGQGQIGYKVVGASLGPYTDINGEAHDDGLYFQIETEGAARFHNMEYIGKIDVTGGGKNTIRPYAKVSESEYQTLLDFHGTECACCNTSRKRNELYAFRCTEDSMNPETGAIYEKGNIYPVGSSCVDKFTGVKALDIIEQLSGEIDLRERETTPRGLKPSHLEPQKFMMYAMAVSKTCIDEAFSFYKRHRSFQNDSAENIYNTAIASPKTYRTCVGTQIDDMVGNITRTAVATYYLCETGYVDRGFFKTDEQLKMFEKLMETCDFKNQMSSMGQTAKRIKEIYASDIESDSAYMKLLNNNLGALSNSEWIYDSHAQKLVDVCDAFFLQRGSCAMHEDKTIPYEVDDYGNIEGRFVIGKTPDGKPKETRVKINGCQYYGHTLNNRELTKLYNGYPILLEDCMNHGKQFSAVVSIQPAYSGGYMLRNDTRFTHNGHIDISALKKYRPPYPPENARIVTTSELVIPNPTAHTVKVASDMKTGEKERRYKTAEVAAQGFNYYANSNLVKGAGQFEIAASDATLVDAMRNMSDDMVGQIGDLLGLEDSQTTRQKILVSEGETKKGVRYFKLAYSGFAEDNAKAKECQEVIENVVKDMFSNYTFDISSAKPISDVDLVSMMTEERDVRQPRDMQNGQNSNAVQLNECLLTQVDKTSELSL